MTLEASHFLISQSNSCQNSMVGDLQDGEGVRRGDHLPPHKYIRNTSTCGTTPTEHILNAGRRPQTSQKARNSPRTWVVQKKKEKTETKNRDRTCTSGRELWRKKSFHTLGSPFTGGDGVAVGEASETRRRAQQQGCGGQSGEICTQRNGDGQPSPAWEACLLTCLGGWGWELTLWLGGQIPGRGLGLSAWTQPEGG